MVNLFSTIVGRRTVSDVAIASIGDVSVEAVTGQLIETPIRRRGPRQSG
jgi:hypothetical protein